MTQRALPEQMRIDYFDELDGQVRDVHEHAHERASSSSSCCSCRRDSSCLHSSRVGSQAAAQQHATAALAIFL